MTIHPAHFRLAMPAVVLCALVCAAKPPAMAASPFPSAQWDLCTPEAAGLRRDKLAALSELAGGRGCVVRPGRMGLTWGDAGNSSRAEFRWPTSARPARRTA